MKDSTDLRSYRDNPMWSRIEDLLSAGRVTFSHNTLRVAQGYNPQWREVMLEHSPMISHPDTVETVLRMTGKRIVAVLVGNAYWPWLLGHHGAQVHCLDDWRMFRPHTWGNTQVHRLDPKGTTVRAHDDATLLLVSPVKSGRDGRAAVTLNQHQGHHVVYIGTFPPPPGRLAEALAAWEEVENYPPVHYQLKPFRVVHLRRPQPEWISQLKTTAWPLFSPVADGLPSPSLLS